MKRAILTRMTDCAYSEKDTENVRASIKDYGFDSVEEYVDISPIRWFEIMTDNADWAKPGDTTLIYFSAHGFGLPGGEDEEMDSVIQMVGGGLWDDNIYTVLQRFPKDSQTLLVFDCCNGGSGNFADIGEAKNMFKKNLSPLAGNFIVLCAKDRTNAIANKRGGLLTQGLCEFLRSYGNPSYEMLTSYLYRSYNIEYDLEVKLQPLNIKTALVLGGKENKQPFQAHANKKENAKMDSGRKTIEFKVSMKDDEFSGKMDSNLQNEEAVAAAFGSLMEAAKGEDGLFRIGGGGRD